VPLEVEAAVEGHADRERACGVAGDFAVEADLALAVGQDLCLGRSCAEELEVEQVELLAQVFDGASEQHGAFREDDDGVREVLRVFEVVRGVEDGRAELVARSADAAHDVVPDLHV